MTARPKLTTADFDDFLAERRDSNRRWELVDGEIIEKMPTQLHAYIIGMLAHFIISFLQKHPIGYALIEARYRAPNDPDNDLIPDLSFVRRERGPLLSSGPAPYMPDLAVEAQSEGQSDKFMSDTARLYLSRGGRMVWIIYPTRRIVETLTANERHLLTIEDMLDGGDVLPDFRIPIRELFPKDVR